MVLAPAATPTATITGPDIESWLPAPALTVNRRRVADAPPWTLWEAAGTVRLEDCRLLGRILRWRIPGLSSHLTYRELFSQEPFVLLEEHGSWSLSGLCGRIWTLQRDYRRLDGPDDFTQWREPGTVRVLFANWVEPVGRHSAALVSQTRIAADDRGARRGLAQVRPLISAFVHLIDHEPLAIAVRRAEDRQLVSGIRWPSS